MQVLEKDIERQFRRKLRRKLKVPVLKLTPEANAGYPDRMVLLPGGRAVFVELKRPGEMSRPLQIARIAELSDLGYPVVTTSNADKAVRFVVEKNDG